MRPSVFSVRLCAVLLIAGASCVAAAPAHAQAAAPAAAPPAEAAKPKWASAVTFSTSWQAGVTKQTLVSLDGSVGRISEGWSYWLSGQKVYGKVRVGTIEQKIADSDTLRFLAEHKLTPRTFVAIQPAYVRNEIQAIDYHLEFLGGYGVHAAKSPKGTLDLVGIAGVVKDDKNLPAADGTSGVVGILQAAGVPVVKDAKGAPVLGWKEQLLYLHDAQKSADSRLNFEMSLTGRVHGPLNISISYQIVHEAKVRTGSQQDDQRLMVGAGVQF